MTGMTFRWLGNQAGSNNPNDILAATNWLVEQGGRYVATSTVPSAGDTILVPAGTISDNGVNFVGNPISLLGNGSQLNVTGVTFDAATQISAGSGVGAAILVGSGVVNAGTIDATAAGAALYLKLADPSGMQNTGLVAVGAGNALTLSEVGTNSGTFTNGGGSLTVQPGGSLDIGVPVTSTGTIITTAGTIVISGTLANSGGILVQSGGALDTTSLLLNSGTITVSSGSVVSTTTIVNSGVVIAAGGTVSASSIASAPASGVLQATSGGSLYGGTISAATVLAQGGTGIVGNALGDLLEVGGNGTLRVTAADAASAICFLDSTGTLITSGSLAAPIYGFGAGDVIDLTSVTYATLGTVAVTAGQAVVGSATLNLPGANVIATSFNTAPDGRGGTLLTVPGTNSFIWSGAASGSWTDPTQWSGGAVPGANDLAMIVNAGTTGFTVTDTGQSAGSIVMLAPAGTLTLKGTVTVIGAVTVTEGDVAFASGAVLTAASLTEQAGSALQLSGAGTISLSGALSLNDGQISLAAGSALQTQSATGIAGLALTASTLTSSGAVSLVNGQVSLAAASSLHALSMSGASAFTLNGSTASLSGGVFLNNGPVSLSAGSSLQAQSISGENAISLIGGSSLEADLGSSSPTISIDTQSMAHFVSITDGNNISILNSNTLNLATLNESGAIQVAGSSVLNAGTVTGTATISVSGTSTVITNSVQSGTLTVASGSLIQVSQTLHSSLTLDNNSMIVLGAGANPLMATLVANGGTLGGSSGAVVAVPTLDILTGTTLQATGTIVAASLIGSGIIADTGPSLTIGAYSADTYSGLLEIDTSHPFNNTIDLAGVLILKQSSQFQGAINILSGATEGTFHGFADGQLFPFASATIDMQDISFAVAQKYWDPHIGIASLGSLISFSVTEPVVNGVTWSIGSDANGGTSVSYNYAVPVCYVSGTRIATVDGEESVDDLTVGDMVLTRQDAGWKGAPLCWVGKTTVNLNRHPNPETAAPIRITAHAFAPNVPHRDLLVSPDHAVLMDGVLMQAQALVNGATIRREPPVGTVTYFHLEVEQHSLLLAEGLPAESYLDTGNRGWFDHAAGVRPLFPDYAGQRNWTDHACLPLVLTGAEIEAAHSWLVQRAIGLGHRRTTDPGLRVIADNRDLTLLPNGAGAWRIIVPALTTSIRLVSRSFVPDDADPTANDRRRLGVAISRTSHLGQSLSGSAFGPGWHAEERAWRWTNGDAVVNLPLQQGPSLLVLSIEAAGAIYWQAAPTIRTNPRCDKAGA